VLRFRRAIYPLTGVLWVSLASGQQLPSSVQSQVQFEGPVALLEKGKSTPVSVTQRTWFIRPGTKVEDLRAGTPGNLVIEVRTGVVMTTIDGHTQTRRMGDFFVVSPGQKLGVTTADRSSIVHVLVLPAKAP